jgi:MFS family permease
MSSGGLKQPGELAGRHLVPELPGPARILLLCRGLRGLADGVVSVLLASYLVHLGFEPVQVGALVTATLLGSALLTIGVGVGGGRLPAREVLLAAAGLMFATGVAFAGLRSFWPLMVVAFVGTLNPSAGDVSVFLPTEQAVLAQAGRSAEATSRFAWYNVLGTLSGAAGALLSAGLVAVAERLGLDTVVGERWGFVLYAVVALVVWGLYRSLRIQSTSAEPVPRVLHRSRRLVLQLSALFSLDSFGGGFVVQSLLVLWLSRRFAFSAQASGLLFFVTGIFAAFSQLVSPLLAQRIGHIRTMSYTHLPANLFLILGGVMPTPQLAVAFLLARMALSQMDVPARQAYVMAMVPVAERPAAAAVTNVPRSLAAAVPPLLAGFMLEHSSFGWPLVVAGVLKATYDILILMGFRHLRPAESA